MSGNTIVHATYGPFLISAQVSGYVFRPSQSVQVNLRATDYTGSNPFGHDVTKLFISNAGATDAKFNLRVLYN